MDDSIVAKHVRLRIPAERQRLGREAIGELERRWEFIDAATDGKLPSRVLIVLEWQSSRPSIDSDRAVITIGMADAASLGDVQGFLLHSATRELARLALIHLTAGNAEKEENRFLLNGMSVMLAHEFAGTYRRLGAAWTLCHFLDRQSPIQWKQLAARLELSGNEVSLHSAAAGITFLSVCRDQFGRERVQQLFESLAKKNLEESVLTVFKTPLLKLEIQWLTRIRNFTPEEITIAEHDAPVLDRILFVPQTGKAGSALGMRVFTSGAANLSPAGIFAIDESSGRVLQGRRPTTPDGHSAQVEIPIEEARPEGKYRVQLVAVDEGGNVRIWEAFYSVSK